MEEPFVFHVIERRILMEQNQKENNMTTYKEVKVLKCDTCGQTVNTAYKSYKVCEVCGDYFHETKNKKDEK